MKALAANALYSDVHVIFSPFVACSSQFALVHGLKTKKQFVNTLNDEICKRGAPHKLVSDRVQVEISEKVKEVL